MRFQYLRDPLCLICIVLYGLNRWAFKPISDNWFLHSYLNDLICIPFWVPIMLGALRRLGLRSHDRIPQSYEVLIPLVIWSIVFEIFLPRLPTFTKFAVPDPNDIFFYTLGASLAWMFWSYWYREGAEEPVVE
jgi:hypothetical protein